MTSAVLASETHDSSSGPIIHVKLPMTNNVRPMTCHHLNKRGHIIWTYACSMNPRILPVDDRTSIPGVHEGQNTGMLQLVGCSNQTIVLPSESITLRSHCLWLQQNSDLTHWLFPASKRKNCKKDEMRKIKRKNITLQNATIMNDDK